MRRILTALVGMLALLMVANADTVSELRPVINEAAAKNGVDPVLMEAIIRLESGNATSRAARTKNNLAGIMGRKGQRTYGSKEECVHHLGSILGKYKAKGRVTVAQIARSYCQARVPWTRRVTAMMGQIRAGRWGALEAPVSAPSPPADAEEGKAPRRRWSLFRS